MLKSQGNVYALLGAAALGGVLALPFGLGIGAIPLVLFAAGDALAAMFVPSMSTFRARVDEEERRRSRVLARERMLAEIAKRVPIETGEHDMLVLRQGERADAAGRRCVSDYNDMLDRVQSLTGLVDDSRAQLGSREIEKLQEATLDFLSLWLARIIIDNREASVDPSELRARVEQLDRQIGDARTKAQTGLMRQLQQARNDYAGIVQRYGSMTGRSAAIDAAMLAMPDKVKEIHQLVMSAPFSSGLGSKLEDSLSRLRLEEQLEQELNAEIYTEIPENVLDLSRPVRAAQAGKRRSASIAAR